MAGLVSSLQWAALRSGTDAELYPPYGPLLGKWVRRLVALGLAMLLILSCSACSVIEDLFGEEEPVALEFSYQTPIIPLEITVNTWGEVNIGLSPAIVTPLGTFEASAITDPTRYFDGVENTLTIRIDDQECIYDLNGGRFRLELQEGNFKQVAIEVDDKNIFVELDGDGYTGCKQRSVVNARRRPIVSGDDLQCPGASPSALTLGGRAVVSVSQVAVHTTYSELASLVKNKYLVQGRVVSIIDGPVCGTGNPGHVLFWKVQSEEIPFSNGQRGIIVGWIGEESGDVYLLRPY